MFEVIVFSSIYIYFYIILDGEKITDLIETVMSILIILNTLICPYSNSQFLKIYPHIIQKNLTWPRRVFIIGFISIVAIVVNLQFIYWNIANFYSVEIDTGVLKLVIALFVNITVVFTILQHLVFYGCVAQNFINNSNSNLIVK